MNHPSDYSLAAMKRDLHTCIALLEISGINSKSDVRHMLFDILRKIEEFERSIASINPRS